MLPFSLYTHTRTYTLGSIQFSNAWVALWLLCRPVLNLNLTVTEFAVILCPPSVVWPPPGQHRADEEPALIGPVWLAVSVCPSVCDYQSVNQLSWDQEWGVISRPCFGLIGSSTSQRSTCGSYFGVSVCLEGGGGHILRFQSRHTVAMDVGCDV